jgi:glycosyltransferase involved in cell wall biosynthesis
MKTIVTLTPLAVEADSRTFKQAASMTRFGYHSVVVEGNPSRFTGYALPFHLLTLDTGFMGHHGPPVSGSTDRRQSFSGRLKNYARNLIPKGLYRLLRYFFTLVYKWNWKTSSLTPDGDLYYLHGFYQFPAVFLLSRRRRVRYIYDAHDFYGQMDTESAWGWEDKLVIRPFERWLEFLCVKYAAAVVTVCPGIGQLLQQKYGKEVFVVRNCQDMRLSAPLPVDLRQHLKLAADIFLLVVIGNEKSGSATRELLEAIAQLPNKVHLALLGNHYEPHDAFIREAGLPARVHIVKPVKPFEVDPFIASADASAILYYPRSQNYNYALPNKFFHAIGAGLPLLYPELPEIEQLARSFDLGRPLDPRNPESIRQAISELIKYPDQLRRYKQNVIQAREVLNWENEEKILKNLLHRICMT